MNWKMASKVMCQLTNGVKNPLDATLRRLLQSEDSKPQLGFHRDWNSRAEAADCNLSTTAIQLRTHCSPRAGQDHTTTTTTIAPLGCRSKHNEAVGHRAHYCLHLFCQSNRSVSPSQENFNLPNRPRNFKKLPKTEWTAAEPGTKTQLSNRTQLNARPG